MEKPSSDVPLNKFSSVYNGSKNKTWINVHNTSGRIIMYFDPTSENSFRLYDNKSYHFYRLFNVRYAFVYYPRPVTILAERKCYSTDIKY